MIRYSYMMGARLRDERILSDEVVASLYNWPWHVFMRRDLPDKGIERSDRVRAAYDGWHVLM